MKLTIHSLKPLNPGPLNTCQDRQPSDGMPLSLLTYFFIWAMVHALGGRGCHLNAVLVC